MSQKISNAQLDLERMIDDLVTGLSGKYNLPQDQSGPSVAQAPIKNKFYNSGDFSYSPSPRHKSHMGVDMRAPGGTPVYPMMSGVVTQVGSSGIGGNYVNVQHSNNLRTYYAHLGTVNVRQNDRVTSNTILGTVGDTGNAKGTYPHLHFQVWKDNQIQNPASFFSIPAYSVLDKNETAWLSDRARQEASSFNMKQHLGSSSNAIAQIEQSIDLFYKFARVSVDFMSMKYNTDYISLSLSLLQKSTDIQDQLFNFFGFGASIFNILKKAEFSKSASLFEEKNGVISKELLKLSSALNLAARPRKIKIDKYRKDIIDNYQYFTKIVAKKIPILSREYHQQLDVDIQTYENALEYCILAIDFYQKMLSLLLHISNNYFDPVKTSLRDEYKINTIKIQKEIENDQDFDRVPVPGQEQLEDPKTMNDPIAIKDFWSGAR